MYVELLAKHATSQKVLWRQSYSIDALGNPQGSAMARLVSTTVSLAVEAILEERIGAGVSAAPSDMTLVSQWMAYFNQQRENINHIDHLA